MSDNWISVKDMLPNKEFMECLVFYDNAHYEDIHYSEEGILLAEYEGRGFFRENGGKIIQPSHWMPLPKPPEDS
jgi:hypothetical protein